MLSAQTESTCITWEGLAAGDQFGKASGASPGAVFYTEANVPVKLLPFRYLDGSEDFQNVSVWGPDQPWDFGSDQFLFVSNINLRFDFTQLATPVDQVCLRFKDGGGQENIAVNGRPIRPVTDLKSLLTLGVELAPGVEFSLIFEDGENGAVQEGVLCLRGRIDSLTIGGQEFAIDDICLRESGEDDCAIRMVKPRITRCYPDGSYDLTLALDHRVAPTDSFDISIEGADYGRFAFDQLPLRFEKVPILTDALTFNVTACRVFPPDDNPNDDNDEPCCQTATVEKISCPGDGQCALGRLRASGLECLDNGSYRVTLDFSYTGVGEKFVLETASGFRGEYSYSDLPLTFESPVLVLGNVQSDVIEICDKSSPGCCLRLEFRLPCAPDVCRLGELQVTDIECLDNGTYNATIDVRHAGTGEKFFLKTSGGFSASFAYGELPKRLTGLPIPRGADGRRLEEDLLQVCDAVNSNCCTRAPVKLPCAPSDCALGPIKVTEVECLDNGTFNATLNLERRGNGEKFFVKIADGNFAATYAYNELPLRLRGLPQPLGGKVTLIVCDAADESCCVRAVVELPCRPTVCQLGELQITAVECLPDGTYNATIDVRHAGTGEKFLLKTGGGFGGAFAYSELPKRLRGLPIPRDANGQPLAEDVIQICDAEQGNCCTRAPVVLPCPPGNCALGPIKVTEVECLDNGVFNATINFERRGNGEKFIVKIPDSDFSATYAYNELPLRLRGLPQSASGQVTLLVCDASLDGCCVRTLIELPCRPGQCRLGDLEITAVECRSDGTYNATLNFRHTGDGGKFALKTAGGYTKEFTTEQLPLRLTGLPIPPDSDNLPGRNDLIKVCALGLDVECCTQETMELPCPPACPVRDLQVVATPCDETGKFYLKVNMPVTTGMGNLVFVLVINGENRGMYRFGDLPLKLGPFPGPLREEWRVEAYLKEHPDCRARAVVAPFECPPLPCALGNPVVSDIECLDDGTYDATIDFRHRSTSGKFILRTAGGYEETFAYEQLPVRVTGLPIPQANTGPQREDIIKVCDAEFEDCCAGSTVWLPCDVCTLGPLVLEPQPCTEDGAFSVSLNFRHANTGGSFTLMLNEETYGQYAYDELPLLVGPFPGEGQVLRFKAIDDERDCFTQGRIEALTCNNECQFARLQARPTACEDGQFFVDLTFVPNYTGGSGFLLFADGAISGPFLYTDLPRRVGPFEADGRTVYDFLLLDVADPTCYGYVEVGPVDCEPEACRIGDLALRFKECLDDGRYRYVLNFRYEHPGNRFFDLFLGEEHLGYYPLADLPLSLDLKLPNLPNTEPPVLTVCINDQPDCCARVRPDRPQCVEDPSHEVWPGDANTDNIANHLDLLNVGIAFGRRGPARTEPSNDWEGVQTTAWDAFFANGTNFKHADTNGDGAINAADKVAILRNYNRTHGTVRPADPLPTTDLDPPIFVDLPQAGDLPTGTVIEVPIQLGSAEAPVTDIYGLAFTLRFDPAVIAPESVEIIFPTTWFGQPDVNVITLDKSFATDGYVEVALSRTDQNEVSGYGPIALFRGIIDDIAGFTSSEVGVEQTMAMDRNEVLIQLRGQTSTLTFNQQTNEPGLIDLRRGLRVFPNPTSDQLRITNQHGLNVEWIDVLDSQGRQVGQRLLQKEEISLEGLPEGLYILRMKIGEHIVSQRVVKFGR